MVKTYKGEQKMKKGFLNPENCNKAMCKSCIFRTDGNQVELGPGRLDEIKQYLIGESSHICHTTEKTCYGALTWQAQIFHAMGMIPENTVKSFLETANRYLSKPKK